uniref:G-protein coupled receptors family 1 profile domain-containing protein n=1 Tax=Plectus sambesii TaxID=2011161 RepID=A0A914V3W7_9BILA
MWTGSPSNRFLCKIAGIFVLSTATCSFGFPAMIAADRFYKISALPQANQRCSVGHALFKDSRTIPVIAGWFFLSTILNLPLPLNDANGEDPAGFCGAKEFTSIGLMIYYELTVIASFAISLIVTGIYYFRLAKWLRVNQSTSNREAAKVTQSLMKFTKIAMLLPLFTASPVVVLSAGQMILPELPMWLNRLLVAPYFIPPCANPWLTVALIKPIRKRYRELIACFRTNIVQEIDNRRWSNQTMTTTH